MNPALENLKVRGFFQQCSDVEGLSRLMDEGPVTFYEGTDPTGPSLHIGHMVPFFACRHLLAAGHKFIALIGGGTARIGDPSGKTEMRKILSYETLDANAALIRAQLERFLGADEKKVQFANNKDWLATLNYIDFLREIGSHFSVNRMLSFEAYKLRMETGLSFIEFNYQLLQSYDFLQLHKRYGCRLQIGGDDQWGNIVAGADLIRRIEGAEVYGMTFPLVTTSDGKKMGKTEKGAIFLNPKITSPYEFFQYWRNIQDADIRRFLLMFTFLPVGECESLCAQGKNPNEAKERLAWEVTALIHGKDEADKALAGARASFGGSGGDKSAMPKAEFPRSKFEAGYNIVDIFTDAGLAPTKSEARRLVQQGGAFVSKAGSDLEAIADVGASITALYLDGDGELILRAGKKRYCRVMAK
ncbi:tyrosine--tRNA ligase [Leadbettera azotonutricia]|uniref:Tyrosine--tRNA ligase n=1 Tax=Leadbettera azotonutricia (strain ATCC BAA-888 / DSM 13862 / ZAS-9) TaxID=545695 RepID=F5Y8H9_LEAAZ|nr:tyrosine--tRNA ligase [Leadbettera azotonutricia]AEF81245.1 tyrosine--tRNA ligase [Leadbettera azotonutricia ZAS-9]